MPPLTGAAAAGPGDPEKTPTPRAAGEAPAARPAALAATGAEAALAAASSSSSAAAIGQRISALEEELQFARAQKTAAEEASGRTVKALREANAKLRRDFQWAVLGGFKEETLQLLRAMHFARASGAVLNFRIADLVTSLARQTPLNAAGSPTALLNALREIGFSGTNPNRMAPPAREWFFWAIQLGTARDGGVDP